MAGNWDPQDVPDSSPDLIFGETTGPTTLVNDIAGAGDPEAFTVSSITFAADAPAYTLGGNPVRLNSDGGQIINLSDFEQVIDFDILGLRANPDVQGGPGNDFTVDTGAGGLVLNGRVVSESNLQWFWKQGSGVLTLTNNNNYFDVPSWSPWARINIEEGTLRLGNTHVIQGVDIAGIRLTQAGTTLDFAAGVTGSTFYVPYAFGVVGSSVVLEDTEGEAVTLVVNRGGQFMRSVVSGKGRLVLDQSSTTATTTLTAANTYSGGTEVLTGRLHADNNSALGTGDVFIGPDGMIYSERGPGSITIANNIYIDGGILQWPRPATQPLKTGTTGEIWSAVDGGVATQFFLLASTTNSASGTTETQFSFRGSASGTASNDNLRLSDVFFINETGQRDYAIQLQVSTLNLGAGDAYLGFYDSTLEEWIPAVDTVFTDGGLAGFYEMSWADFLAANGGSFNGSTMRGAHGFDATTGSAWAVLDMFGNGDLAIVAIPEPGTVAAILGALALGLAFWRRSRREGSR